MKKNTNESQPSTIAPTIESQHSTMALIIPFSQYLEVTTSP